MSVTKKFVFLALLYNCSSEKFDCPSGVNKNYTCNSTSIIYNTSSAEIKISLVDGPFIFVIPIEENFTFSESRVGIDCSGDDDTIYGLLPNVTGTITGEIFF